MTTQQKRITVKLKTPNPLFEQWLTEWKDQAKSNDSKMQYTFNNALKTLQKYPIPLESGKDCIILKGFGNKICEMLDQKLLEYKRTNITINNQSQLTSDKENKTKQKSPNAGEETKQSKGLKVRKDAKLYRPAKGTGAYAILVILLQKSQELKYSGAMTKVEIIEHARLMCDKSFVKPDSGTFYTAWSSMSTLVTKGLVARGGKPQKFSLTPEGETVAATLTNSADNNRITSEETNILSKETSATVTNNNLTTSNIQQFNVESISECNTKPETDKLVCSSKSSMVSDITDEENTSSQTSSCAETIIFAPYSFDVILLVDKQETEGGACNPLDDETVRELSKLQVNFEVRHLKVGDFTWICRERNTKQELILPFILERKRMDDLGRSIRDGRFYEQKFRLKQCGIENLMYLVESYGNNTQNGLPLAALMQGATNTLIQDQFQVKFTENHRHSMQYLSGMTVVLKNIYEKKTVMNCTKEDYVKTSIHDDLAQLMLFTEFNKNASKMRNFKVQEIFVRQLVQLRGVSVEKALAIVEKYQTPTVLKLEYDRLGIDGEKLLANIPFGPLKRSIGQALSRTIYQLYTINDLNNL